MHITCSIIKNKFISLINYQYHHILGLDNFLTAEFSTPMCIIGIFLLCSLINHVHPLMKQVSSASTFDGSEVMLQYLLNCLNEKINDHLYMQLRN